MARQNATLPAAPGAFAAETIHVITIGRFDKKHFMKNSTLKAEELNTFFFSVQCAFISHTRLSMKSPKCIMVCVCAKTAYPECTRT